MNFHAEVPTWFIAYTESEYIFHYGLIEVNQYFSSGQETVETFIDEQEWISRKLEIGIQESIQE